MPLPAGRAAPAAAPLPEGLEVSAAAPPIVHEVLRGPGVPLEAATRRLMERRFGHDFAHVRVHADELAAESARAVGAVAYTVGRSIVFDRGRYRPGEGIGQGLLAHELAHTIQQSGAEPPSAGQPLRVASPTSTGEDEARTIATASAEPRSPRSPAFQIRSRLRSTRPAGRMTLQRAVTTSGGDWSTDHYEAVRDKDQAGHPVPAAQGVRGADITLRFKPNNFSVNAELIGLVQSVQSYVGGALALTPAAATRAIPAADAKPINTGAGETDEGTAIDMAQGFNNPLYVVSSVASASLEDRHTDPSWGQLGWHYIDAAHKVTHQDATLVDTPRRAGAQKDSRQIFEVTALATKGVQAGTYYGSVRWGWRTDGAANLTKIDLQTVSEGMPSSTFLKAAGIWDKGKSSTGAANVKLSAPQVMVTPLPTTLTPLSQVMLPVVLPAGTRVRIVSGFRPPGPVNAGTVEVVDGPHTGLVGDIQGSWLLPVIMPERP